MKDTKIEWTDSTWNPIRGCSRVSEGCRHCYAESVAARFSGPDQPYEGLAKMLDGQPRWTGVLRPAPMKTVLDPLRWDDPRRVFANSMSDLYHEAISEALIDRAYAVMILARQHTFQVLTKRAARMQAYHADPQRAAKIEAAYEQLLTHPDVKEHERKRLRVARGKLPAVLPWPAPNVWNGVSVEDQQTADERIPLLLATLSWLRWVSYEPALGPVDFRNFLKSPGMPDRIVKPGSQPIEYLPVVGLDWGVIGGESGRDARPFDLSWAYAFIRQFKLCGVPAFVKQLGARPCDIKLAKWEKSLAVNPGEMNLWLSGRKLATIYMPRHIGQMRSWHTWDENGVGGENGRDPDVETAMSEAVLAVQRQGLHWFKLVSKKGGDTNEWPDDLRVREYPKPRRA